AQRKNVTDEEDDQQEKLTMLVRFVNENIESPFPNQYKDYDFNKVYSEDLDKDNPFVQQNVLKHFLKD
ncbi:unnamed protein product, partial [Adineta steineri]